MLPGYLMYCLIEKYLIGTFKGMYKISSQCFNRFVEGLGDLSVYSHLFISKHLAILELLWGFFCCFFFK